MATFQEFHGISLAANSFIENLFVEQLASDPVPVGAGRVWFNTTDKVFRQSTLDGGGGVIVRTFATAEALAAAVSALEGADTTLTNNLAAEVTARTAADTTLTNNLAAEVTARTAADVALGLRIDALGNAFNYVGTTVGGADAGSATDLALLAAGTKDSGDYYKVTTAGYFKVGVAQAAFYANVGDGLVFNLAGTIDIIDNTNAAVTGTTDEIAVTGSLDTGFVVGLAGTFSGRVSTLESGLATEVTARTAADTALDGKIGTLGSLTTTVKTDLVSALNEQVAALATEVTARTAADTTLTNNLATEVTARTAADTALDGKIGTLGSLTTTDKTNLVAAVNEVKALAGGGVSALVTQLNSYRYTETTSVAATTHTINHALASTLVDVCVWIDRGDGTWRNDMAAVSIVDANNVKVDLSASRNVRVTVERMEDFV